MNRLLTLTAIIEVPTGLALIALPSVVLRLLLGSSLDAPPAATLGRVAGAALLALGIACWLARNDGSSGTARGLVGAMFLYNLCTAITLGVCGIWSQPVGIALWPAVILHTAMALWCVACLLHNP